MHKVPGFEGKIVFHPEYFPMEKKKEFHSIYFYVESLKLGLTAHTQARQVEFYVPPCYFYYTKSKR